MSLAHLYTSAVGLLRQLISTPSLSKQEHETAAIIEAHLQEKGVGVHRYLNNVWAVNKHFDPGKPSILLNSHHDTVKPDDAYTNDPFAPLMSGGKLYGLGSNDAGGCLVSLMAAFLYFYDRPGMSYNLVFAATAEEEISGANGIEALLKEDAFTRLNIQFGIVGEPTQMNLAVAEKGLMVLDCTAYGKAGHAARNEGENAIYKVLQDIEWFKTYAFDKVSPWLGPIKMTVTVVNTENKAHNIVPSVCTYVVDIRITETYAHEEILDIIKKNVQSEVRPRSMRLRSTGIALDHPIVKAGLALGKTCYGSPTSSDKALMAFSALKCGPGNSARSHTADEYIELAEIENGINDYVNMLKQLLINPPVRGTHN